MNKIQVKRLFSDAKLPTRAYPNEAGADLYSRESLTVVAGQGAKISTGVAFNIPEGYYAQLHTRSSMAKKGWAVVGGVMDCSYKGEYFVVLRNISEEFLTINVGDRIAQVVIYPIVTPTIVETDDIGTSERQAAGFGSTGT